MGRLAMWNGTVSSADAVSATIASQLRPPRGRASWNSGGANTTFVGAGLEPLRCARYLMAFFDLSHWRPVQIGSLCSTGAHPAVRFTGFRRNLETQTPDKGAAETELDSSNRQSELKPCDKTPAFDPARAVAGERLQSGLRRSERGLPDDGRDAPDADGSREDGLLHARLRCDLPTGDAAGKRHGYGPAPGQCRPASDGPCRGVPFPQSRRHRPAAANQLQLSERALGRRAEARLRRQHS